MPSDDLLLNVKQIVSYPNRGPVAASDAVLLQAGGIGGPYYYAGAQDLVSTALISGGPFGVYNQPPANSGPGEVYAGHYVTALSGGSGYNAYFDPAQGQYRYFTAGPAATLTFGPNGGWFLNSVGAGAAGAVAPLATVFEVSYLGAAQLPQGTLTVSRDPQANLEVSTKQYVDGQVANLMATTVRTFMGRTGDVTLGMSDIVWAGGAPIWSPAFQGRPTAPTPAPGDHSTCLATTDFVWQNVSNFYAQAKLVTTFNGRVGDITLTAADVTTALGATALPYAPINSPQFTGVPTAPTPAPGDTTGTLATTAFVMHAITAGTAGVSSFNTRTGAVVLASGDISGAGGALLASPSFTGAPVAPTAPPGTNTAQLATTAFVAAAVSAVGGVSSFNTRTGAIVLTTADLTGAGGATLASPAFTGTPTAPTASVGTNTTQLATTAFVVANAVASFNGRTGAVTFQAADLSAVGGAPLASPAFSGIPTAPTATTGTNTTQLATTAFVAAAVSAGAVTSFNTRTGAVSLIAADVTAVGGALLAGPAFTGVPTAPTAAANSNTTQLATTAYVTSSTVASFNGRTGTVSLQAADVSGVGGALLAGPAFTGAPTAPTATAGTSTTQIATTAFVAAAITAAGGVTTFNGRAGAVTLTTADITGAGGAPTASPTFTGTVTAAALAASSINVSGLITPSDSGLKGVTDGSNAPAGSVGEWTSSIVLQGAAVSIPASGNTVTVTSLPLSAGDWDVEGFVGFVLTGPASTVVGGIGPTAATISPSSDGASSQSIQMTSAIIATGVVVTVTRARFNLSAAGTAYLCAQAAFASGAASAFGKITARRRR